MTIENTGPPDVVILCGGLGTRLKSVLDNRPKPLADINSRPFLDILIDTVANFGFKRFILCTGYRSELIEQHYSDLNDGRSYIISREESPMGTGGAVKLAEPLIESNPFLVLNGDSFCPVPLDDLMTFHLQCEALASIALTRSEENEDYGNISLNDQCEVIEFREKDSSAVPGWINAGVYLFDRAVLSHLPEGKTWSLEYDVFPSLIHKGLYGYTTAAPLYDIGTPERLERARKHIH